MQFASSPHNPLLGYARGAKKSQAIGVPDAFETLPVDDKLLLSRLVYVVHHMHDDMPMVYTEFDERPAKQNTFQPPLPSLSSVTSTSSSTSLSSSSGGSSSSANITTIAPNTSVCTLDSIVYRLRFNNLDYVDSDFIDYLTTLMGVRITRLTVAPHMMELSLPQSATSLSQDGGDDEGNDGDTEDEQDEEDQQQQDSTRSKPTRKQLQPLRIPSVRLTIYVQPVNTPIKQMYGLPDESATKSMVEQTCAPTAATLRNLNVLAMWSRLTPKRKHVAMHEETDLETDTEGGVHRAKRIAIRQ